MFDTLNTALKQFDPAAGIKLATVATVFGMLVTTPALAAPSVQVPCPQAREATLHVSDTALASEFVNHNAPVPSMSKVVPHEDLDGSASYSLLAPRAEAAIRDAFEADKGESLTSSQPELAKAVLALPVTGADGKAEATPETEKTPDPNVGMNAKLPGISDDDLIRYKKQMYRRDI